MTAEIKTSLKREPITIPVKVAKKLSLKEGTIVEAEVKMGKLFITATKDKTANIMQYAGLWKNEDVLKVFKDIRKKWSKWEKSLSV